MTGPLAVSAAHPLLLSGRHALFQPVRDLLLPFPKRSPALAPALKRRGTIGAAALW